jgi:hypothetical protein
MLLLSMLIIESIKNLIPSYAFCYTHYYFVIPDYTNDGSRDSCFDHHNIPHPTIDTKNTIVTAIAFVSGEDELHWLSPH